MGISVLHKAIYSANSDTAELLLKNRAFVNLQYPSNGDTPLHDALYFKRGKDLSVIKVLLKFKPRLSIRNRARLTPIESAKVLKDEQAIKLLEDYESARQSPAGRKLMDLVRQRNFDLLKKEIAKVDNEVLNETDDQGFTPLLSASRESDSEVVKLLLERGANPNHKDEWALHDATAGGHREAIMVLKNAGANLKIRGHDGRSALDIARANKDEELMGVLSSAAPTQSK